ncbi:MAG: phosphoribosylformylglycinamidine synthase subunit PurS, partial [Planctomycetes bacterium]|nr:phosphoribosylformylglycinamidine synthase subunit PurS [Planctomycetota bacterium]
MIYRVEIRSKESFGDPHAQTVFNQVRELGMDSVSGVRSARLFFLVGEFSQADATRIADELLTDPVIEEYHVGSSGAPDDAALIEVHLKAGVMDPVAASAEKAVTDMGLQIEGIRTARRYELLGDVSDEQRRRVAGKLLANPVIEEIHFESHTPPEISTRQYDFQVVEVPIRDLDDEALMKLSTDGDMFLNITEMKAIQDYFKSAGREPRDVELEMIAQTWSEHCGHKTFRSDVVVRNNAGEIVEEIPNLLKNTVFGSTKELDKPWCLNVFEDNAGVIEFDENHAVCFKVETHNHPSAIEPSGGAATGIGGVVHDPMGTGLGASPVANTDIFCFGPTDMPLDDVPKGVLHPRRVMRGVVGGVRDYGNRMGIPTVNGAVYFDERYLGNPLVYCGTVGMLPIDKCTKRQPAPGDAIICVGGRTGRDGIHGATFSSGELTHEHETEFSHAVQIGNAITEKKVLDTIIQARDMGLYSSITDCGAGGLSSAVGEMGEQIGAEVHIDRVPLKYAGLTYAEIWISEAQERMVLAVPPDNVDRILKVFADE